MRYAAFYSFTWQIWQYYFDLFHFVLELLSFFTVMVSIVEISLINITENFLQNILSLKFFFKLNFCEIMPYPSYLLIRFLGLDKRWEKCCAAYSVVAKSLVLLNKWELKVSSRKKNGQFFLRKFFYRVSLLMFGKRRMS